MNEENEASTEETPGIVDTIKTAVGLGDDSTVVDDAPVDDELGAEPEKISETDADAARRKYRSGSALVLARKRKTILAK